MAENLTVTETGVFEPLRIDIVKSLSIINRGIINSNLYVQPEKSGYVTTVHVTNSGEINGGFYVASDANVVQVIQSRADVTKISVDRNFSVLVRDANDVSLADVIAIATNADKLTLDNSTVVLNKSGRNRGATDSLPMIEFVGDVVLKLNTADVTNVEVPLLQNVSEVGHIHFDVLGMNPLYDALAYVDDGKLYARVVRETDYTRALGNDVGNFLNDLRRSMPDDKLLSAMDNAPDISTINSIISDSVRLHPINLMVPVRRMHMLDALGGWRYSDVAGVDGSFDLMFSDVSVVARTNIAATGSVVDNVAVAIGGYVGALDTSDDINEFSGYLYGANMMLHFDNGMFIGNLSGGLARTDFSVGPVFDGATTVNNPSGISGYAAMDVGAYLYQARDITVAPFVGVVSHYASVLNDTDMTTLANLGLDINLSEHDFDILYDYGLRGNILTDGAYHIGAFMKFSMPADDMTAQLSAAYINDEFGDGYKISVSLNMAF